MTTETIDIKAQLYKDYLKNKRIWPKYAMAMLLKGVRNCAPGLSARVNTMIVKTPQQYVKEYSYDEFLRLGEEFAYQYLDICYLQEVDCLPIDDGFRYLALRKETLGYQSARLALSVKILKYTVINEIKGLFKRKVI